MTPDYCYALESLAKIHTREYNYQEATVYLEESLDIKSRVLGAEHALVGALKSDLARCYYTIKDYTKAETLARSCVDVYTQAYGEGSLELANAWHNLGNLYHVQEKYDSAGDCYQKSLPVKKRLPGGTQQRDYQAQERHRQSRKLSSQDSQPGEPPGRIERDKWCLARYSDNRNKTRMVERRPVR
ncbi:MAG TPA: tetratricopeptide repeat protein [Candidatus Melainabacteria bacterium]|nr:tetratricopeptide repeat protein [Candidatus Melainabacteria bacterium]